MGNRNPWLEHVKKVSKQMKSKTGEEKISLKEILKEAKLTWPAKKENMNAKKEDMNAEKEDMNVKKTKKVRKSKSKSKGKSKGKKSMRKTKRRGKGKRSKKN